MQMNRALCAAILFGSLFVLPRAFGQDEAAELPSREELAARLQQVIGDAQPEGENGWAEYEWVCAKFAGVHQFVVRGSPEMKAYLEANEDHSSLDLVHDLTGDLDEADPELLAIGRAYIKQLDDSGLLDDLDDLAEMDRFVPPKYEGAAIDMAMGNTSSARDLARLCKIRMNLAAFDGDALEYSRSATHALVIARAASCRGVLISHLLANAVRASVLNAIADHIQAGVLPSGAIRSLLKTVQVDGLPWQVIMEGEQTFFTDALLDPAAILASQGMDNEAAREMLQAIAGGAPDQIEMANRLFDAAGKLVSDDRKEEAAALAEVQQIMELLDSPEGKQYFLVGLLVPALDRAAASTKQVQVLRGGIEIMLNLELHKEDHGGYPEDVADLVPRYMEVIPADPFSDGVLGYRRLDEDHAGRAYLIWSAGLDGVDDGGREHPDSKYKPISKRGAAEGYDFVINWVEAEEAADPDR